jgi:predicted nucleotidyltransferase
MTAENVSAYGKFRSRGVRVFLKTPVLAVILHWIFQSLFYMDPTERWFKISLDYLMAGAIAVVLRLFLAPLAALAVAIALAHTINFLLNGQLWGVLKHYGLVYTTPQAFEQYLSGLSLRALKEPSIQNLYVYGSLARQEWSPLSDLDVRLVQHPGVLNGLRACWFVLKERSRALLARFPIDIYVMDQASSLNKLRPDEPAVAITELEHLRVFSLPPSEIHNR